MHSLPFEGAPGLRRVVLPHDLPPPALRVCYRNAPSVDAAPLVGGGHAQVADDSSKGSCHDVHVDRKDERRALRVIDRLHRTIAPKNTWLANFEGLDGIPGVAVAFEVIEATPGFGRCILAVWPEGKAWLSRYVTYRSSGELTGTSGGISPVYNDHSAPAYVLQCSIMRLNAGMLAILQRNGIEVTGPPGEAYGDLPGEWQGVYTALWTRSAMLAIALSRV